MVKRPVQLPLRNTVTWKAHYLWNVMPVYQPTLPRSTYVYCISFLAFIRCWIMMTKSSKRGEEGERRICKRGISPGWLQVNVEQKQQPTSVFPPRTRIKHIKRQEEEGEETRQDRTRNHSMYIWSASGGWSRQGSFIVFHITAPQWPGWQLERKEGADH